MKAIEMTGRVDEQRRLRLDTPLPPIEPGRVRVIILFPEESDAGGNDKEWLLAATTNPAFDFLNDPAEDIYTMADGKPFSDQG